jgi:hypothetical protein
MGNTVSAQVTPLPAVSPKDTVPKPCRRTLYKLPFTFTMSCSGDALCLDDDDIQDAIGLLYYEGLWLPYLREAMEDSWMEYLNRDVDPESEYGAIRKEISEPLNTKWMTILILKTESRGTYTGFVYWKSRVVPAEILQRNLEWRIGEQMSLYEIQSDEGRWYSTIEIGAVGEAE